MNTDLRDRVILVTGGTGSLGHTVSRMLLERGAQVVTSFLNAKELDKLTQELPDDQRSSLTAYPADVTDPRQVTELVGHVNSQFRRIDGVAHLVGAYNYVPFTQLTWEQWSRSITINLHSAFLLTHAVLPHMIRAGYGRLVAVGSRTAAQAQAGSAHYNAGKAGLMSLMESISNEYRTLNITANTVLPSVIDTPANRQIAPQADFTKWVRPEEVAELIVYLLSPESSGTSGDNIPVYGKS